MERGLKTATVVTPATAEGYVGWEEVYVCEAKGMREVHYYLKKKDGGSDLAVIGKEKSLRHMTYRFLLDFYSPPSPIFKLRSRREVIDWLHSFFPDSPIPVSPQTSGGSTDGSEADELGLEVMKGYQIHKLGHHTKQFQWVGSPSTCKKRRKHYEAFCRNGVTISVHGFVYVLAEEDKRLVAYLDDMYEDAKGNKMVVVRWFHKIDEVGIDLRDNFNVREIFYSLCLQDLSIECIDGLAAVLSPEHYAKFLKAVKHTELLPFVCHQQYDSDELKPLDITKVRGYWKQDIVKYVLSLSSLRASEKSSLPNDSMKKGELGDFSGTKPRKRLRLTRDSKVDLQYANVDDMEADYMFGRNNLVRQDQQINDVTTCGLAHPSAVVSRKDMNREAGTLCTAVGSVVEVLSQDSGMRGCWFRAIVIKKHKNKVKLRYNDIKDAENEANCLEEWVLASRVAARDETGLRTYGRTTFRPSLSRDGLLQVFHVGTIVDVWWHDGWWEGIVIRESDDKFHVYFPGEKREDVFSRSDLRRSQEWTENAWKQLQDRPDLAASILCELGTMKTTIDKQPESLFCKDKHEIAKDELPHNDARSVDVRCKEKKANIPKEKKANIPDLSKDDFLSRLKWKTSRKRRRVFVHKVEFQGRGNNRTYPGRPRSDEEFMVPMSLKVVDKESCKSVKVDHDNCKFIISESLLGSSVVPPLTNLVMSR